MSDEALVALAARGDAEALGKFYDRYGRVAFGLALRVLGDDRAAEAVIEEAFMMVGRTNGRLAPTGTSASTWILGLVHRQAIERLRNTRRAGEAHGAVDGRQTTGGDGVGLQRERALDHLTDAQREMLVLAYYDGLTVSELAGRLGQTPHVVTATLHAGLSRIRDALAEETAAQRAAGRGASRSEARADSMSASTAGNDGSESG